MTTAADAVRAYRAAAHGRDRTAFAALLADDVVYELPQTRGRVGGRDDYLRFNVEGFAGDWHLTVVRVVGEGRHAASWIEMTDADGSVQPGLCFFELDDSGVIAHITDLWPDPYEHRAQRSHLVERY